MTRLDIREAFKSELDGCKCSSCKAVVHAIFAVWSTPVAVSKMVDAFIAHTEDCFYHRYQAHQDG